LTQYAVLALDADFAVGSAGGDFALFTQFVWMAVVTVCAVPVIVVALIGEIARVRAFFGMLAPPASSPHRHRGSSGRRCICQERQTIISRNCGLPLFFSSAA